jgi:hypothetical protein
VYRAGRLVQFHVKIASACLGYKEPADAALPDCSVAFEQSIAEGFLIGIGGRGSKAGAFRYGGVNAADFRFIQGKVPVRVPIDE